jgi:hypothetical protein
MRLAFADLVERAERYLLLQAPVYSTRQEQDETPPSQIRLSHDDRGILGAIEDDPWTTCFDSRRL